MPRSTEKGIPSPLHSLPPNPTAHCSYESGLQCLGPVPVPVASLSCYVVLNSHMASLCYQLILPALSPWFSGLMHASPQILNDHNGPLYLHPVLPPLRLRENMIKKHQAVALPQNLC